MDVHHTYVDEELFTDFLDTMPQVCVEVLVQTEKGVLVAKRTNKPQVWFWPGGRLYKGETLPDAAHRIAREELGIEVTIEQQLGVHSHFWNDTATDTGVSRHTVNIVYQVSPQSGDEEIELDDQHTDYRFLTELEDDLHEYVQEYLRTYELLPEMS